MDSARPEVLDFYRQHGAEVIDLSEDQDSTDLHKCLAYIEQRFSREQLQRLHILVVGALYLPCSDKLTIRLPLLGDCSAALMDMVQSLQQAVVLPAAARRERKPRCV
jgi:thiamine pyrophosphokinase